MTANILFGDGYDDYGTDGTLLAGYYDTYSPGNRTLVTGLLGTGKSLRCSSGNGTNEKLLGSNQSTLVASFAITAVSCSFDTVLAAFTDGGAIQVCLVLSQTSKLLRVCKGNSAFNIGVTLATSTNALPSTRSWVEFKAIIHNSAGFYEVKINGSSVGWIPAASAQNTRVTANNFANRLGFQSIGTSDTTIDDMIVSDDYIGEHRISTRFTKGAGASTAWTAVGAPTNWQAVKNNLPATPSDAINVKSATPSQRDTYDFDDETATSITCVIKKMRARKTDLGLAEYKDVCVSGATTNVGAAQAVSGSFAYYSHIYPTDPATGVAWTTAGLNSAEFGQDRQ
jgi:hypothetical protein